MSYLRGTDLEYGASSLPDVQCRAAPRLATHYWDPWSLRALSQGLVQHHTFPHKLDWSRCSSGGGLGTVLFFQAHSRTEHTVWYRTLQDHHSTRDGARAHHFRTESRASRANRTAQETSCRETGEYHERPTERQARQINAVLGRYR
jgi:hypothetical protein